MTSSSSTTTTTEVRLNIRLRDEQRDLIRLAAHATGQTVSSYVLTHVLEDAHDDLADRQYFALPAANWVELQSRVGRPPAHKPELEKLLSEPAPWTAPAEYQTGLAVELRTHAAAIAAASEVSSDPPGRGVADVFDDLIARILVLRNSLQTIPALDLGEALPDEVVAKMRAIWDEPDGERLWQRMTVEVLKSALDNLRSTLTSPAKSKAES